MTSLRTLTLERELRNLVALLAGYSESMAGGAQLSRREIARLEHTLDAWHYPDAEARTLAMLWAAGELDAWRARILAKTPDFDALPLTRRRRLAERPAAQARANMLHGGRANGRGLLVAITKRQWVEALATWRGRKKPPAGGRTKARRGKSLAKYDRDAVLFGLLGGIVHAQTKKNLGDAFDRASKRLRLRIA